MAQDESDTPRCSFCHKSQSDVAKLISNPSGTARICDECIKTCHFILEDGPGLLTHPVTGGVLTDQGPEATSSIATVASKEGKPSTTRVVKIGVFDPRNSGTIAAAFSAVLRFTE